MGMENMPERGPKQVPCLMCNSTGKIKKGGKDEKCPRCNGVGYTRNP
jgi:DnaJ-class molecular chaperone